MKKNLIISTIIFLCIFYIKPDEVNYSFYSIPNEIKINKKISELPINWYKNAIFYEIFVRSFYDSNNDGIGDIKGVIEKLDYLHDLGISGIWLMPINTNSDGDHGYAITDYMNIDSSYGTFEDLNELIEQAHKRGIGIIMDMVINHCSKTHPFFESAVKDINSQYRNWFVWSNELLFWRQPWSGNPVWHETRNKTYYYGLFSSYMPDFNFKNEEVYRYFQNVLTFWLNKGIDGFRFDAATHIFENGSDKLADQPETIQFFKGIRNLVNQYDSKYLIGEANQKDYIGDGSDSLNGFFNFGFIGSLTKSIYNNNSNIFSSELSKTYNEMPNGGFISNVAGNHDSFLGPRVATRFKNNTNILKIVATTLLTTPGIPFIYYGEEIGMTSNNAYKYDWSLRTPMQWDGTFNSGFSKISKITPRRVNKNYKKINVDIQFNDKSSLLNHYKSLIKLRNSNEALKNGNITFFSINKNLISYKRQFNGQEALVIINITNKKVNFDSEIVNSYNEIFKDSLFQTNKNQIIINPYSSIIYLKDIN